MTMEISIDDLCRPVLSDGELKAIAAAEANPADLSQESILRAATEATGLSDFGPDDFRTRLRQLVDEWNGDASAYATKRNMLWGYATRYASNRLLIQDILKRHPEIHDEEIRQPIFIAGLPRSGTTHLHNLLGADSRLRSTPLWEANAPVPNPRDGGLGPDGVDPRYARTAARWQAQLASGSLSPAMHANAPDQLHEDVELMGPDFASYYFEFLGRVPQWRDFYLATDQTPHYEYMKTVLKILQWQDVQAGGERKRWITKSPQHLEQLPILKRVFPDATLIVTYRDPVEVIQSIITMIAYGERMTHPTVDARGILEYWTDRVEILLRACTRDRDLWPQQSSVDVPFETFMADPLQIVRQVRETAGLTVSDKADREVREFIANHPRGKYGQVVYNLERDFGVSPADLRKRFSFYFEAYLFLPRPDA